ncbi:70 kDa peptidyl-prolyl isomerase-like [Wolffia australiana]
MSRLTFSAAAAKAAVKIPGGEDSDEEEEPGEEIESAPPFKIGEEREMNALGLKKKLLKAGRGWETPSPGDEVTVHYVARLPDGRQLHSSRDRGDPITFRIGEGKVLPGMDHGLVTMRKEEISLFTLPSEQGYGDVGPDCIPLGSDLQYEVELISWLSVVDVCKDGGIVKKILLRGEGGKPGDLDEVTVKYRVLLPDGSVHAEALDGVQFYINMGHLCPALPKILKTMEKGEKATVTVQPQYAFGENGRDGLNRCCSIPPSTAVLIDLELVSFHLVVDVVGDLKVVKKILKEGEGHCLPNDGATVTVRYTGKLEDGTIFEKFGLNGEEPLQFILDEELVITGLDRSLATMAKGEVSLITVKPEYGYGSSLAKAQLSDIPASSTLIYEVEMLDFTKEKELWELNFQERIEVAEKLKEKGNSLVKIGRYQLAAKRYDKAIESISDTGPFSSDEEKLSGALRVSCWLNKALCSLKLKDFRGAIVSCSKVLEVESCNVKALFRRAQAYLENYDLDLAELDLKKGLEIDPLNREMRVMHKLVKDRRVEKNKTDAQFFANMFPQERKNVDAASKRQKVEEKAEERVVRSDDVAEFGMTSSTDAMLVNPSEQ